MERILTYNYNSSVNKTLAEFLMNKGYGEHLMVNFRKDDNQTLINGVPSFLNTEIHSGDMITVSSKSLIPTLPCSWNLIRPLYGFFSSLIPFPFLTALLSNPHPHSRISQLSCEGLDHRRGNAHSTASWK